MKRHRLGSTLLPILGAAFIAGCATVSEPPAPAPGSTIEVTPVVQTAKIPANPTSASASQSVPRAAPASAPAAPPAPAVARTAADPLSPTAPVDLDAPDARTDLWARIRAGYALPTIDNDLVRNWEQWYASRPDYVQRMTTRGGRYLFHIVEELSRRGMPTDLALLPFVESAYNPQARSVAKATGMWQFVSTTGRDFALRQNVFRDDRRDVLASTRAALDYLQALYAQFGDWQLALAAYNWGQGNVQRAIARNQRAGLATGYDDLRLPDETRNYLPKLQAVKNILDHPESFGLTVAPLGNHPYFLSVKIERDIDVDLAARLAGLPIDEFKQLNPQLNKPVILAKGTPQLLLPYDSANIFVRAIANHHGPLATWTAWQAPRTLKPAEAARQVGMDEQVLREVNAIPTRMLVKAGSTLLVRRDPARHQDVAAAVADDAVLTLAPEPPPLRQVKFKAGPRGDTVAAVARRYHVSPTQVAQWNQVKVGSRFKAGEIVVVMLAPRPAASKHGSHARHAPVRRSAPTTTEASRRQQPPV